MSGSRRGIGWSAAIAVGLALALSLALAGEAQAGKYAVAQCGWFVDRDASWSDTTGGAKFRADSWCVPPPGADPFDGAHVKSFTRGGGTVTGTRFARWRWQAPGGTYITAVRGTWWHALHDGMQQRIGGADWGGGFSPVAIATATDTAPREFSAGFNPPTPALEDRLLCARGEDRWCSLDQDSWSALRALTITLEDPNAPAAGLSGEGAGTGWHRGTQPLVITGFDAGSGLRFGETSLDGNRVAVTEYACSKASIGGEWRATKMLPCPLNTTATQSFDTTRFSDGPHTLGSCEADFSGGFGCVQGRTVYIDNTPPAHPRAPQLAGGDGWRHTNDFDLSWGNPDQGPGSPIAGAVWRIVGPNGYDSQPQFAAGRDRSAIAGFTVPAAGSYALQLWLRDEAGNEAPSSALTLPLRFDDLKPAVAFATEAPDGQLRAEVEDEHSGPAGGGLFYRRVDSASWTELPAKLVPGDAAGKAHLVAPMPDLGYGTWVFRADAVDVAGNAASTTLRTDGTQMAVQHLPPPRVVTPHVSQAKARQAKTRLFARLRGGHGRGDALTVPFGALARLSGHLLSADGAALAGREVRVVARPSRGALARTAVRTLTTGDSGGFELRLPAGPSRRVTVSFLGSQTLAPARRPGLELRVRSGVTLRTAPTALRTGQLLRLSGRVARRGAPVPRRGKLVAIQYLEAATHRWRPVLVTRSDHDGRFHARYRFRYVSGRAAIRLRATALAEEHWPYAPGSSPPVTVTVSSAGGGARAARADR